MGCVVLFSIHPYARALFSDGRNSSELDILKTETYFGQ